MHAPPCARRDDTATSTFSPKIIEIRYVLFSGVGQPGPGPGKICLCPCKNFHAAPRAVKAFLLHMVIVINLITACVKSLEYSSF